MTSMPPFINYLLCWCDHVIWQKNLEAYHILFADFLHISCWLSVVLCMIFSFEAIPCLTGTLVIWAVFKRSDEVLIKSSTPYLFYNCVYYASWCFCVSPEQYAHHLSHLLLVCLKFSFSKFCQNSLACWIFDSMAELILIYFALHSVMYNICLSAYQLLDKLPKWTSCVWPVKL